MPASKPCPHKARSGVELRALIVALGWHGDAAEDALVESSELLAITRDQVGVNEACLHPRKLLRRGRRFDTDQGSVLSQHVEIVRQLYAAAAPVARCWISSP